MVVDSQAWKSRKCQTLLRLTSTTGTVLFLMHSIDLNWSQGQSRLEWRGLHTGVNASRSLP